MSGGTDQGERVPACFAGQPFGVDEARFADRVALAAGLARHLRFTALAGHDDGTWDRLFQSDESLVIACIAATDVEQLQRDLDAAPPERWVAQAFDMARTLDGWWTSLSGHDAPAARTVRDHIAQAIAQRLGDDLAWLAARHPRPTRVALSAQWQRPAAPRANGTPDRDRLRAIGFGLVGAMGRLQSLAEALLGESLASGRHEPAATLLMAFLQTVGSVQARLNDFTRRHIHFYYRDCLGLRPAAAAPDRLHLACLREARAPSEFLVPDGALFDAGRDAVTGTPLSFRADSALTVTDATVAALCTVRVERDPLISPERDFGFATRIKAAQLTLAHTAAGAAARPCHPLFGGSGHGAAWTSADARLGLAIATPVLLLAEGAREVHVRLMVSPADAGASQAELLDGLAQARSAPEFRTRLAPLFVRWLLAGEALDAVRLARLREAAARWMPPRTDAEVDVDDALHLLQGQGASSRPLLFSRLVNGLLDVTLTAAEGWHAPDAVHVLPDDGGTLHLAFRLQRDDPPIVGCDAAVHGAEWPTRLPVLRMDLSTRGRLLGHGLLSALHVHEATVSVKVTGLSDVVLGNDLGRLDPAKPFQPFGPLPVVGSYLVFGSPEMARKRVSALTVDVEWGGLPTVAGGFGAWYAGHAPTYRAATPTARLAILRDGRWQDTAGPLATQALFHVRGNDRRLVPARRLTFDPASLRKHSRAGRGENLDGPRVQAGLYRVQLTGPEGAFGHAAYPVVLAGAVTVRARARRMPPRPNPPYTPVVQRLSVDYEAADCISLTAADTAPVAADRGVLFHLHPFGMKVLQPAATHGLQRLLPVLDHDGSLYIGLAGRALAGPLTLLFHLRATDASDTAALARPARTHWACLVDNTWHALAPERVLADGTAGFLTTGIVTLDLPPGLTRDNDVMPRGLQWLRLSADEGFEGFAGLRGVQAQALRVTRVLPDRQANDAPTGLASDADDEAGRRTGPLSLPTVARLDPRRSVAGLAGVAAVDGPQGGRDAQASQDFHAAAGERLQHKQRASTPWDIERLVLANFPSVSKARCLPAQALQGHGTVAPGEVLVVVVPQTPRNAPDHATAAPRLEAHALREVQAFLAAHASPWMKLRVRNAAYERIQVRCTVDPVRGVHEGVVLRQVRQALVEHLSPWMDGGCGPQFDWTVRCEDVQAHLRTLDTVEAVTQLSLLQVGCSDDGHNSLFDTARPLAGRGTDRLQARHPWTLALPMGDHLVQSVDGAASADPMPTGIRELAIGNTFIIGGVTS